LCIFWVKCVHLHFCMSEYKHTNEPSTSIFSCCLSYSSLAPDCYSMLFSHDYYNIRYILWCNFLVSVLRQWSQRYTRQISKQYKLIGSQTDRQTKSGGVKRYAKSCLWFARARCLHLPLWVEQVALSFWRRGVLHFSAGRKLWRQMPLDGWWWVVHCFPLPKKFHRHQYIDEDIITLVMKELCPLNSGKQSVIIVKRFSQDFHKIQTKKLSIILSCYFHEEVQMYPTTFIRMLLATVQAAMNVGWNHYWFFDILLSGHSLWFNGI